MIDLLLSSSFDYFYISYQFCRVKKKATLGRSRPDRLARAPTIEGLFEMDVGFKARLAMNGANVDLAASSREQRAFNVVKLWHACPWANEVTDYDKKHLCLFGLLIDAEMEGASAFEMAACFFNIRANPRPDRALRVVRTHLARAHWLKENFFRF